MLCLCLSGGLQAGIRKSNLKVLYVGGSPDVDYVGNRPDSAVLAQSSAKRMASFDKMLKRYFRQVTVIRAKAYRPELSDNYDVTVMDGRPAPILPGIMERDSSGRLTRYEKTGYLPPDFDRPMVKKPMRTLPYIDDTIAPDSLPMWRVQKEGYMSKRGIRVGMVSRPGGFEDSPEAEIISGGELAKELMYYGVSAISLVTTGSHQEGLRACTSFIKDHQYAQLDERMKLFAENHPIA